MMMIKGVLQGGEIPPLNKIYKRLDEISPLNPLNLNNSIMIQQQSSSRQDSKDDGRGNGS